MSAFLGCVERKTGESATQDPRRLLILEKAHAYASYQWEGTTNSARHGTDPDGVRVDTPDDGFFPGGWRADGSINRGVPYKWGGFSSLEEFNQGIASGLAAGDLSDGVDLSDSRHAVGVDCSGLIARCWDLPFKQSTRSLGRLSYELEHFGDLRPGDLINKYDVHAMLFVAWEGSDRQSARVIEANPPRVRERIYSVSELAKDGYRPLRYKPLDDRWQEVDLGLQSTTLEKGSWEASSEEADITIETAARLIARSRAGDWTRYRFTTEDLEEYNLLRVAQSPTPTNIELKTTVELNGKKVQRSQSHPLDEDLAVRLLSISELKQPSETLKLSRSSITSGTWRTGARSFPACQIKLVLEGSMVVRGQNVEFRTRLDSVISPEVCMEGVIRLEERLEATLGGTPMEVIARYELVAFGTTQDEKSGKPVHEP